MSTCILFNPRAGAADEIIVIRESMRDRPDVDFVETHDAEHLRRTTVSSLAKKYQVIVAAGGDGTIHTVINAMMSRRAEATLGIIPLGTGNDLARMLDIPTQPAEAVRLLDHGEARTLDLMKVRIGKRTLYGHNVAAGGFTGQMNEVMTDELKQTWGPFAYLRGAMKVLPDLTQYRTTLRYGGKPPQAVRAMNIIVANGRTAGGGVVVAPQANPEDGLLDVVIVRAGTALELTGVAARLLAGDYTASDLVTHARATRVEVDSQPGMWFNVDGELLTNERIAFSIVPRAIRVIVGPQYAAQPEDRN
jgi:diacylglycerol kinase (ATP)